MKGCDFTNSVQLPQCQQGGVKWESTNNFNLLHGVY